MLLKRFYDEKLAQASYLVGCQRTGEALVVDPNRDVEQYLEVAREEGLAVTHVTETHIHADFVSGSRELAQRAGAQLYLSDEGDADWKYRFAADAGARLIRQGDSFKVGNVRIDVRHTPGHTPEHCCFLVTDTAGANRPMGILSGDFIFVGDVGRPDLLERAAKVAGTMERAARQLFHSIEATRDLPDYLQVWPGHGAGSACGKTLGAVPMSTLGYERLFNWAFQIADEDAFVRQVLAGQPEPPRYFAEMKRINKEGPPLLSGIQGLLAAGPERLPEVLQAGGVVVDARPAVAYARGHVPGTVNVPLNRSFTTWAGWLIPYDHDFHLIVEGTDPARAAEAAARDLAMIGLDRLAGYFTADAVRAWAGPGRQLGTIASMTADQLRPLMADGSVTVLDVRGLAEWEAGHLPGAENIPVGYLAERADRLRRDRPLVLQCESGSRSAIAASVLQARGLTNVVNLAGGLVAWTGQGYPVEQATAEQVAGAV